MVDSCATCFFFRTAPATAGPAVGATFCNAGLPDESIGYPWKPVQPDWWCTEGADAITGLRFNNLLNIKPGADTSGDKCNTCFAGRVAPVSAGPAANRRYCHGRLPYQTPDIGTGYPWRPVSDDWWCGAGADVATGRCFTNFPKNGVTSFGGFTLSAGQSSVVILDPKVNKGSEIILFPVNLEASKLIRGAGGGAEGIFVNSFFTVPGVSFLVSSDNGGAFSGLETFNYVIVN